MEATEKLEGPHEGEERSGTLGDVLYADRSLPLILEREWVALVRAVAKGDQLALHALYERAHRMVFTLCLRITRGRETAEEVTLDVFHDVWRRASGYDPANGTVLGWIMNQARSRAIDRVRFETRKKRVATESGEVVAALAAVESADALELQESSRALRAALSMLNDAEREAIQATFFAGVTYAEAASRLGEPLGTIKTRIRSALLKLRRAMPEGAAE
ncbi:MAG TPA: sigma-70 family RNA polymerase sigma factor [Burkholderiales bacterium]|nr:sigma-70 family RNA polymerase sigma factor [Burkholderiales bacterium]